MPPTEVTSPNPAIVVPNRWAESRVLLAGLLLTACSAPTASADNRRSFDVPAGEAAVTLKHFAAQGRREVMFPAEPVADVKTHAVKGYFSVREALDQMVAGTGLTIVEDAET